MKTKNYTNFRKTSIQLFGVLCLGFLMLVSSCKKDDEGGASFALKDNPTDISVTEQGTSQTFTVQTSGTWKVEPVRTERWLKIASGEGSGNGTFTVTVDRNATLEERTSVLTFVVDGRIQNYVLKIVQEARTADNGNGGSYTYLDLGGQNDIEVPEEGLNGRYVVRSTGDWRVEIIEGEEWLNIVPMEGHLDAGVNISVAANLSPDPRTARVVYYLDGIQMPGEVEINQDGVELILFEDFNWLNYGNQVFNTTTGETRIGLWRPDDIAKGWTSTINPVSGGGDYASIYARPGFIKLGRTGFGGDLISPKLSEIEGTKDLRVTFKAAVYMTAGGTVDHNALKVGVNGPGTVSVSEFRINNPPDYTNDPQCIEVWNKPEATYTFTITGATAETQVWFMGGAFDMRDGTGWPKTVNRIFLDDILVSVLK